MTANYLVARFGE